TIPRCARRSEWIRGWRPTQSIEPRRVQWFNPPALRAKLTVFAGALYSPPHTRRGCFPSLQIIVIKRNGAPNACDTCPSQVKEIPRGFQNEERQARLLLRQRQGRGRRGHEGP